MSKLYGLLLISLVLAVLINTSALAQINTTQETEQVNQAYNWLSSGIKGKWADMSVEDNAFSLLAAAYDDALASEGKDALLAKSRNGGECWPSSSCKLRDTALSIMALSRIGHD